MGKQDRKRIQIIPAIIFVVPLSMSSSTSTNIISTDKYHLLAGHMRTRIRSHESVHNTCSADNGRKKCVHYRWRERYCPRFNGATMKTAVSSGVARGVFVIGLEYRHLCATNTDRHTAAHNKHNISFLMYVFFFFRWKNKIKIKIEKNVANVSNLPHIRVFMGWAIITDSADCCCRRHKRPNSMATENGMI